MFDRIIEDGATIPMTPNAVAPLLWYQTTAAHDPAWDEFVDRSKNGHHEQTTAWGRVKAAYGWAPIRLIAGNGPHITAGVQILERRLGPFGRVGYIMQGPVFDFDAPGLAAETVQHLDRFARSRYSYLVVDLPYAGASLEPVFVRTGFLPHPEWLPPANSMDATLVIDLHRDLESIFAAFSATKRKHVRRSLKTDLKFRHGTGLDVPKFQELVWHLCASRGSTPNPPQKDFFARAWHEFPGGKIHLFMLENSVEAVGGIMAFRSGDWLRCWKIGSSRKDVEKFPNERIWWETIQAAKTMGVRWFDFVWVDRDTVRHVRENCPLPPPRPPDRVTTFKLDFGGSALLLPREISKIYNPLIRISLAGGAGKLFQSSLLRTIVKNRRDRQGRLR